MNTMPAFMQPQKLTRAELNAEIYRLNKQIKEGRGLVQVLKHTLATLEQMRATL